MSTRLDRQDVAVDDRSGEAERHQTAAGMLRKEVVVVLEKFRGAPPAQRREVRSERGPTLLGGRKSCELRQRRTVQDRLAEKALRQRRRQENRYRNRARRLAEHGDAPGVAAERGDIVPYPLERGDLVEQAVVAGALVGSFRRQCRVREKAEDSDPVVGPDHDDAVRGELGAVIERIGVRAADEAAAVEEHHDGPVRARCMTRCPDTQSQTVFAGLLSGGDDVRPLHAVIAKVSRIPHALPWRGRLRCTPAQRTDRWCCVRDSLEALDFPARPRNSAGPGDDHRFPGRGSGLRRTERRQDRQQGEAGGVSQEMHRLHCALR